MRPALRIFRHCLPFFLNHSRFCRLRFSCEHASLQDLFFGYPATNRLLHSAQKRARHEFSKRYKRLPLEEVCSPPGPVTTGGRTVGEFACLSPSLVFLKKGRLR